MIRIEQEQIPAPRFRITSFDGKTPARFCRRGLLHLAFSVLVFVLQEDKKPLPFAQKETKPKSKQDLTRHGQRLL